MRPMVLALGLLVAGSPFLSAQPSRDIPIFRPERTPGDPAEAARMLARASDQRFPAPLAVQFAITQRGSDRRVLGQLWGAPQAAGGNLLRLLLPEEVTEATGAVYESGSQEPATAEEIRALQEPILAEAPLRAFHLVMPYLSWPGYTYEGMDRSRGRAAHVYLLSPPASYEDAWPALRAVRLELDAEFGAPLRVELLGEEGMVLESLRILSFKRFDDQWLVKALEVRDRQTRTRIRLELTHAKWDAELPPHAFASDYAVEPLPAESLELIR